MSRLPEWIAVDAEGGVVDLYRLLGLDAGESDAESIRRAIERARARLDPHRVDDATDPLRALIDRAEEILTSRRRKAAYDEVLRSRYGAVPGPDLRERSQPMLWDRLRPAPGQGWKVAVTAVASLVAIGLVSDQMVRAPVAYPPSRGAAPPSRPADLATPRLVPPPRKPTVPGLTPAYPRKLPGLGDERGASAPTLSADLLVLVFVKDNGPRKKDLFITTRGHPGRAFTRPVAMAACDSDAAEESPTLSRDALEIIFLRDRRPFAATRTTTGEPFRTAQPIELPGVDFDAEEIDHLALGADGMTLTFRVREKAEGVKDPWAYRVAERAAVAAPFERSAPLPVWSPWAANVLSADGLRCYQATREGLAISTRLGLGRVFGLPGLIQRLRPSEIGPIVGPFWVAPQEDLIVYASPGADTGEPRDRRDAGRPSYLWMVQVR